jgi:hypothetical protein
MTEALTALRGGAPSSKLGVEKLLHHWPITGPSPCIVARGYLGNETLQRVGVTPTSTDPLVATTFATESANYGEGMVHIRMRSGLGNVEVGPGNVRASLEAEVAVYQAPAEFAAGADITLTAEQSRAILREMGFEVPSRIANVARADEFLRNSPRLTPTQVAEFLRRAQALTSK